MFIDLKGCLIQAECGQMLLVMLCLFEEKINLCFIVISG